MRERMMEVRREDSSIGWVVILPSFSNSSPAEFEEVEVEVEVEWEEEELTSLPAATNFPYPCSSSVPSKVSSNASRRKKNLARKVVIAEDSERTRRAAEKGARGPFVKERIAACGT